MFCCCSLGFCWLVSLVLISVSPSPSLVLMIASSFILIPFQKLKKNDYFQICTIFIWLFSMISCLVAWWVTIWPALWMSEPSGQRGGQITNGLVMCSKTVAWAVYLLTGDNWFVDLCTSNDDSSLWWLTVICCIFVVLLLPCCEWRGLRALDSDDWWPLGTCH